MNPFNDLLDLVHRQQYSTRIPDAFAFVSIGFILGWVLL